MNSTRVALLSLVLLCSGCWSPTPTDVNLESMLLASKGNLNLAIAVCKKYENLRAVENSSLQLQVLGTPLVELTQIEQNAFLKLFSDTGIEQVDCLRLYKQGKGRLVSVRFGYFSKRFGIRSQITAIEHMIDPSAEWLSEKLRTKELVKMNELNWYIYRSAPENEA